MRVKQTMLAALSMKSRGVIAAAALAALGASAAHAADLYWDADATGAANGGAGTWLNPSTWATDLAGTTHQTWVNGSDAKMPTTGATVTFGGNIIANSIEFTQSSGGYTFAGGINTLNPGPGGFIISGTATNTFQLNSTITGNLTGSGFNITRNTPSTVSTIFRLGSTNTFTGDININSNSGFSNNATTFLRVSFDAAGGIPTGSQINVNSEQVQIHANNQSTSTNTTVVAGRINLNAGGDTYIGAAHTAVGTGSTFNTLQLDGPITGTGNVIFQGVQGGGGGGVVVLNSQSTYVGNTTFNTTASTNVTRGWVVWGVNDALPTATTINLGAAGTFGTGALDLKGFSQTVASIGNHPSNTGISAGITNSGAALSTLTVTGSATRFMNAPIGVTSGAVLAISPGGADPSNIRLVLSNTHTGSLTLNSNNTYTGGTSVQGGTLLINGNNSSTSSAAVISAGATFGGSGTYAGSVTNSGQIVPGGVGTVGTFTTGALTLNPGAVANGSLLDYDFTTTIGDKVQVNGNLTLPGAGSEALTVTYPLGSVIANGTFPLIAYTGSLSGSFATLGTPTVINGGAASFALQNGANAVNLVVTGGATANIWKGPAGVGSGNWDLVTSNWDTGLYVEGAIVGFDDSANGSGTVTVTINKGSAVVPYQASFVNSTRNYVLTGTTAADVIGGTSALIKNGLGSLTVNRVQAYTGDTSINGGTVIVGAGGGFGSTNLNVNPGGTLSISSGSGLSAPLINLRGGKLAVTANTSLALNPSVQVTSTLDIGANNVTFSGGAFSGTSGAKLIKNGAGTLTLSTAAPSMAAGWDINGGTVVADAVDGSSTSGLGVASLTNSNGWVNINNGGTLQIKNVSLGDYKVSTSAPPIVMDGGSTLIGSGNAAYGRASVGTNNSGLGIIRGVDSSSIKTVDIKTLVAADVFTIQNSLRQIGTFGGPGNSTIRVSGPGTVKLQDGGVSSATAYAGSWLLQSGTLQIGPVIYNPAGSGYGGPFGEPFNALGFAGTSSNGDPDSPNPITVTGGTLALAIDQPNVVTGQNPNLTSFPVNTTPNYLRSAVTLNGGALAATGFEVSYDNGNPAGDQGLPTATKVTARFGGDLTVLGTASKILTYNPANLTEGRTVQLVGGSRTLDNASPNFGAGSTITYVTTWNGVLTVDPGTSPAGSGSFDINRDAGTFIVNPTASLVINAGGTVNLGGAADALSDGTNRVNVTNNSVASFNIKQGIKNVGTITGTGKTTVDAGVTLIGNTIRQSNLTLNGTARVRPSAANAVTSNITTLVINTGGKLDLSDNKLVTKSATGTWSGSDYTGVTGLVASGRNGNTTPLWDGTTGIVTTQTQAIVGNLHSIGIAKASDALPATATATASWGGQTVTGTDTLVMYTYGGDATLDGKINIDDYVKIDSGIAGGYTGWVNGDFNYDGKVTVDDYITVIDANIGNQSGVFPTGGGIDGGGLSGVSAVPEPTSLSLLGLAAVGMMKRGVVRSK